MPLGLESVDWKQKPNARERIMFFAAMGVFLLGFLKACWFPSREALSSLHGEFDKVTQEQRLSAQLQPTQGEAPVVVKPVTLTGAGSVSDVQMAIEKLSQPLLLKGIKLMSMKSSDLEREGNVVRQKIELQLTGNFYSVAEYIEALETLPAPLVIEDFAIALNDDKSGKVMTTIKGSFYGMGQ